MRPSCSLSTAAKGDDPKASGESCDPDTGEKGWLQDLTADRNGILHLKDQLSFCCLNADCETRSKKIQAADDSCN